MEQTDESSREPDNTLAKDKQTRNPRKRMQRTRSFTDALREKYCYQQDFTDSQFGFINIMFRHTPPKSPGKDTAELAHLRNVVLNNRRVSTGGLPSAGLASLCPNVSDLDLSCNLLESWGELLPILSGLPNLTFLNISRNHLTRHKEELWRWGVKFPRVENVVLNYTGIPLREVLALARLMPALRELHICCNYYRDLGSIELAIQDGALSKLECLRLNENIITSWAEVWKLRDLPSLNQLILSENPLCDVFYGQSWPAEDADLDSPNVTCHSDTEDQGYGSPHFRFPHSHTKCQQHADSPGKTAHEVWNQSCADDSNGNSPLKTAHELCDQSCANNNNAADKKLDNHSQCTHRDSPKCGEGPAQYHRSQTCPALCSSHFSQDVAGKKGGEDSAHSSHPYTQSDLVEDLLRDLVSTTLERISVQESCQHCGDTTEDVNRRCAPDNAAFQKSSTESKSLASSDVNAACKAAFTSDDAEDFDRGKAAFTSDEAEDFNRGLHHFDASVDGQMEDASNTSCMTSTPVKTLSNTSAKKTPSRAVRSLFPAGLQDTDVASHSQGTDTASYDTSLMEFYLGDDGDEGETSMELTMESELNDSSMVDDSRQQDPADDGRSPFAELHTLCLSRTSISDMEHLHALNEFPKLRSLKIMDTALFPDVSKEDRRKLMVASLPHVKILNGSEVTATERDKAERHYLRHFMDSDSKPARYYELEKKHGPITPLLDIDLGKKFQKEAVLTFILDGEEVFKDTVCVLQPIGKLRNLVAHTLGIPRRSFRMYHHACGPDQEHSPSEGAFDELCLESIPMSRYDFMDGDEIHIEFIEGPNASPVVHFSKKEIKF